VTNIEDDLSRRDFTCNAIAARYDHNSDGFEFCDPYDGRDDIRHEILRAVGTPWRRFTEDPLRILRLYRFAGQLGFVIEPRTRKQAAKNAHKLLTVSKERIVSEMDKLLTSKHVSYALAMMWENGIFRWFLPELQGQLNYDQHSPYHQHTLHWHTALCVQKTNRDDEDWTGVPQNLANADFAWAALLHDVGKPFVMTRKATGQQNYVHHELVGADMAEGIARRLKFSNERRAFVVNTIENHMLENSILRDADKGAQ
jgi:tRNA nucleotidyltransferase/poly(A) polymerase